MVYYYELTKYPKIYERTYWGCFNNTLEDQGETLTKIINNRNNFIIEFGIKRNIKRFYDNKKIIITEKFKKDNLDHIEYYETTDNKIIIVSSPYGLDNPNFDEIYSLYNGARTFIKIIPKNIFMNKKLLKNYLDNNIKE